MLNLHTIEVSVDPPLFLRKANVKDLTFIKKVSHSEMDTIVPQPWNWESWFDDVGKAIINNRHKVFVIEISKKCVGYLWMNEEINSLWITAIVLQTKYQRLKIGQKIMKYLIMESYKQGKDSIELGVQRNNYAALQFYSKLGFEQFDTLKSANTDLVRLKLQTETITEGYYK